MVELMKRCIDGWVAGFKFMFNKINPRNFQIHLTTPQLYSNYIRLAWSKTICSLKHGVEMDQHFFALKPENSLKREAS